MTRNTIYVNQTLKTTASEAAIAATIVHEATHADYAYNPEKAIAKTLERHPELERKDINIIRDEFDNERSFYVYDPETESYKVQVMLMNSIDQEYTCFSNEVKLWQEIKGDQTDRHLDRTLALYKQGEDDLKADLRLRESYADLPRY